MSIDFCELKVQFAMSLRRALLHVGLGKGRMQLVGKSNEWVYTNVEETWMAERRKK
jgi:hypothetical protein